jgi:V8-like Glu-specific endopeptidase
VFPILLVLLVHTDAGAEPKFSVQREKVLVISYKTEELTPPFEAGPTFSPKTGAVWTQSVSHAAEVDGLRVHVTVKTAGTNPWRLRVSEEGGKEVEVVESADVAGQFWTKPVRGKTARLELSSEADATGVRLLVDRYAYRVVPSVKQGEVNGDQKKPIAEAPENMQRTWAPPIARLTIMTPLGGAYCTGFLIAKNVMMTNEHCIHDLDEARSTLVEFRYDTSTSQPDSYRVTDLLARDPDLDYAVIKLQGQPGDKHGILTIDETMPADAAELVIIQHPGGQPKQVSIIGCAIRGLDRVGVGGTATDFGHLCDTLGGSSGSPVFSMASGKVIGLHHLGYPEGMVDPENQGVRMKGIMTQLRDKRVIANP